MYTPKPNLAWSDVPIWVRLVWLLLFVDAVAFYLVSLFIGGTAAKLIHIGGKYYLSDSYRTTEVSQFVFFYSLAHLATIAVALLLSLIGASRVVAIRKAKVQP